MRCCWAPRSATLSPAFSLGEHPTPEFDQRSVLLRLRALLDAVLAAPHYADTVTIAGDEP
jgi:hypothetical protein